MYRNLPKRNKKISCSMSCLSIRVRKLRGKLKGTVRKREFLLFLFMDCVIRMPLSFYLPAFR